MTEAALGFSTNSLATKQKNIEHLRREIDEIDLEILSLISIRLALVQKAFQIKKELNIPLRDQKRVEDMMEQRKEMWSCINSHRNGAKEWKHIEALMRSLTDLGPQIQENN